MPRFHIFFFCLCMSCFLSFDLLIHERSLAGDNIPVSPPFRVKTRFSMDIVFCSNFSCLPTYTEFSTCPAPPLTMTTRTPTASKGKTLVLCRTSQARQTVTRTEAVHFFFWSSRERLRPCKPITLGASLRLEPPAPRYVL